MKSLFIKTLALASVLSPSAFALSLYDTAPPIGLPESYAIRHNAYVNVGYDDNIDSSSTNKDGGFFTSFGVGASYSDQESSTRLSYDVNLGGRLYDKTSPNTNQNLYADVSAHANLSHSFSAGSNYSMGLSLNFRPEPDFSNDISAPSSQGECLNWSWNHAYSRSIDSRWSWTASANYSGNTYTESRYRYDDRQYLSGGLSLNYRYSPLTSYSLSVSSSYDFRDYGHNSQNVNTNIGVHHSLSPVSSVSAAVGLQTKFIDGDVNVYPTLRFGYNRKLTEGLSVNSYASLYNENVDTYRGGGVNYLSDLACRVGANCTYVLTPKVSFNFGASLLSSHYSKGQGAGDVSEMTWAAHVGMSYRLTDTLSASINYRYTDADLEWNSYNRNVTSVGLSYAF